MSTRTKTLLGLFSVSAVLMASLADARYGRGVGYGNRFGRYGGAGLALSMWPGAMYGGGYGGTTAAGSYMQGAAEMTAAAGQYNLLSSEAAINMQEARSKYIDNRKKWTETYFAMKEENQAKATEKRERNRSSQQARDLAAASGVPRPLSSDTLDPISGKITWPEALQGTEYAASRTKLEQIFELRATTSGGAGSSAEVRSATREMTATLKDNIEKLPPNEYIAARKFLDSLAFAGRA